MSLFTRSVPVARALGRSPPELELVDALGESIECWSERHEGATSERAGAEGKSHQMRSGVSTAERRGQHGVESKSPVVGRIAQNEDCIDIQPLAMGEAGLDEVGADPLAA